ERGLAARALLDEHLEALAGKSRDRFRDEGHATLPRCRLLWHADLHAARTLCNRRLALGLELVAVFGISLEHLVSTFGLGLLFVLVMLESAGIPLPGETALIAA